MPMNHDSEDVSRTDQEAYDSGDTVVVEKSLRKWDIVVYVVIMIVVLLTLGQALVAYQSDKEDRRNLRNYVKCQSEWTTFLYTANVASRNTSEDIAKAVDDVFFAVAEAQSGEQVRAALERYKAARNAQNFALDQNPLPPPPDEVCELDG